MNRDQKFIAEAYEDGVWNKAIKWAQGYKPQLDQEERDTWRGVIGNL